ncbi:MAG: hypothetical protein DM484_11285 [Candidatus Methylumidiphilus alinenensis]|uniref:Uncharacterized protein n=1 Tax=Candidatus Methylumidiphilus alinenensis TaxID=2202197 RepID=A0A2W4T3Y8_9GAMM|nr:MAG: hypothetical protein DM484_11285 [Candidatus Methylumidiphilus alinenensis]
MKRLFYLILGCVFGLVLGSILIIPFNYWYTEHFVYSDNDSNILVSILIFIVWPVSIVFGGFFGNLIYHRCLGIVTEYPIKRCFVGCAGAVVGIITAYVIAFSIGLAFGPLYSSEEDMSRNVKLFIYGSVVLCVFGGWITLRIYSNIIHKQK